MRRYRGLPAFLVFSMALWPLPAAGREAPKLASPGALSGILESLLNSPVLAGDQVGFILLDRQGQMRFGRNETRRFVPASTRKILVTAAALSLLGPEATFSTRVAIRGEVDDGRLIGDLALIGGGDPGFDDPDLARLAGAVAAAGIRRVTGDLIADASFFSPDREYGAGWARDDYPWAFAPPISALVAHGDRIGVAIWPGADPVDVAHPDPPRFAAERFQSTLASAGIEVKGNIRSGRCEGCVVLGSVTSAPLADLVALTNKPSDNLFAELLLRQLGAASPSVETEAKATAKRGLAVEAAWLGWEPDQYRLADGSGLSRYDLVSPRQLAEVLYRMRDVSYFVDSLPIAGVDGTMARRLLGTPAEGKIRAKTGSMGGISALAGYAGERWIFAFVVNGHIGPLAPVRAIQDAVCLALTGGTPESSPSAGVR